MMALLIKLSVKLAGAWWSVFGRTHRGSTVGLLMLQRFRVGLLLSSRLVSSRWWILIFMFAVLINWWVEIHHADQTTSMCIWTIAEPMVRLLQCKTGLSPPVIYYWQFQGDAAIVVYSTRQCSSAFRAFVFDLLFNLFKTALWPSVGKSCLLGFSLVLFLVPS